MLAVERPWGKYEIMYSDNECQIKLIEINPNSRLSLQSHQYRAEKWRILEGNPIVTLRDHTFPVSPGTTVFVKQGDIHRIAAGKDKVVFLEIQTGTYFGEDDIVRYEDDYDRM